MQPVLECLLLFFLFLSFALFRCLSNGSPQNSARNVGGRGRNYMCKRISPLPASHITAVLQVKRLKMSFTALSCKYLLCYKTSKILLFIQYLHHVVLGFFFTCTTIDAT